MIVHVLITVFARTGSGQSANELDENLNAKDLVENILGAEYVQNIMSYLRDIGMRGCDILRKAINEETLKKQQFVIAMMASCDEIRNREYSVINQYRNILEGLGSSPEFRARLRYFRRVRICIILNAPWSDAHGEARLLDPTGATFVDERYLRQSCTKNKLQPFLDKMTFYFKLNFPTENAILLIFSFYIPCTIPKFMCSNLIGEFASQNVDDLTIIVAYESVFRKTKKRLARAFMNKENVYVLRIHRGKNDERSLQTDDKLTWRSCCNKNWQLEDCSFYKFSEKVFENKASRRAYRRNFGVRINKIASQSRPRSYYDTWFDDKLSTVYDYCRVFNSISKRVKRRSKTCRKKQGRSKRQWSNPHEIFWQACRSLPVDL